VRRRSLPAVRAPRFALKPVRRRGDETTVGRVVASRGDPSRTFGPGPPTHRAIGPTGRRARTRTALEQHRNARSNASEPGPAWSTWRAPSEEEIHREHRAALEATLFRDSRSCDELVFELESGLLRLRDFRR